MTRAAGLYFVALVAATVLVAISLAHADPVAADRFTDNSGTAFGIETRIAVLLAMTGAIAVLRSRTGTRGLFRLPESWR
jgi:hypothetical protein